MLSSEERKSSLLKICYKREEVGEEAERYKTESSSLMQFGTVENRTCQVEKLKEQHRNRKRDIRYIEKEGDKEEEDSSSLV